MTTDETPARSAEIGEALANAWGECVEAMLCDCGNFDGHPGDCLMWELIDSAPANPYRRAEAGSDE